MEIFKFLSIYKRGTNIGKGSMGSNFKVAASMSVENDAILKFEHCVSNSNIAKIECMKSCGKQNTLSMILMFVGENNAIKATQRFNEVHPT